MSLVITNLTFDCLRPLALAEFWAEALGGYEKLPDSDDEGAAIRRTDRTGVRFFFEKVEEPKTVKNRFHMDLRAKDMEAEVQRLISLGAARLRGYDGEMGTWTVMADPEGNEFCVMPGG